MTIDVLAGSDCWVPFDFSDKVRSGSVVIDTETSVSVLAGSDPSPGDIVQDVTVDGYLVSVRVLAAIPGIVYCVLVTLTANKAGDLLPVVLKLSRRVRVVLACAVGP
jgi:hypothetical protein